MSQPTDTAELIAELERYQAWRRGDDTIEQPSPILVGSIIDRAIKKLKEYDTSPIKDNCRKQKCKD